MESLQFMVARFCGYLLTMNLSMKCETKSYWYMLVQNNSSLFPNHIPFEEDLPGLLFE